jgi:NADP-dependent alcohol dehydrogenase
MIGHELTALYGIDHAQSLAAVFPATLRHQKKRKRKKLVQLAQRVFNLEDGGPDALATHAIEKTEEFFQSLGVKTKLREYDIPEEAAEVVAARLDRRGAKLGEHEDIRRKEVAEILRLCH